MTREEIKRDYKDFIVKLCKHIQYSRNKIDYSNQDNKELLDEVEEEAVDIIIDLSKYREKYKLPGFTISSAFTDEFREFTDNYLRSKGLNETR